MFDRETEGRVARAEISVFDAMMQEIATDKEIRLRKYMRKHEIRNDGKHIRKEKKKAYRKERYYGSQDFYCGFVPIAEIRRKEAEEADARDYIIEQENIADDAYYAQIEAEYREWERQRQYRHEKYMRNLNDWLKYA